MPINNVTSPGSIMNDLSIERQTAGTEEPSEQDVFLRLMLAQLKNQDPLSPQDSTEFLGQMAQFSTVEGISQLNDNVNDLAGSLMSGQALQASAMVGRTVLVDGDVMRLDGNTQLGGTINLDAPANGVVASILSESGQIVRQIEVGDLSAGVRPFSWDGRDSNGNELPRGNYEIRVEGSLGGPAERLPVSVRALVDSVSLSPNNGPMMLNVSGLGAIEVGAVKEIL